MHEARARRNATGLKPCKDEEQLQKVSRMQTSWARLADVVGIVTYGTRISPVATLAAAVVPDAVPRRRRTKGSYEMHQIEHIL